MSSATKLWPWPAPVDDGSAMHLVAGTRLPDVALAATRGAPVSLAHIKGRAILFIYPFTGTPGQPNPPDWDTIQGAHGSTPEAEGFRDAHKSFQNFGFEVFGLSGQTAADQSAFAARAELPFLLLSDFGFAFANALRLPCFQTGGMTYLRRISFIVRASVIEQTIYPVHPPHTHAAELLKLAAHLKT